MTMYLVCTVHFKLHFTGHKQIIPKVLLMCVVAQVCQLQSLQMGRLAQIQLWHPTMKHKIMSQEGLVTWNCDLECKHEYVYHKLFLYLLWQKLSHLYHHCWHFISWCVHWFPRTWSQLCVFDHKTVYYYCVGCMMHNNIITMTLSWFGLNWLLHPNSPAM